MTRATERPIHMKGNKKKILRVLQVICKENITKEIKQTNKQKTNEET